MKIKLNIEVEIEDRTLECMLIDLPSAIRYWGRLDRDDHGALLLFEHGGYDEGDPESPPTMHKVPSDWVALGLKRLAERDPPYHRLSELLSGDYDAESLDCLFQMAVLNDLIYG